MTDFIPAFLIDYSDSSFTNPHEVVLPDEPHDCRGDFTHMGKKYWGMETDRHKATSLIPDEDALEYDSDAHNWFRIGFKERAEIKKLSISTKYFTGNQVQVVSVYLIDELTGDKTQVLDRVPLNPDAEHEFVVDPTLATECLLECYYEGGIARVNCFGVKANEQLPSRPNLLEGTKITHVSNDHYGKPGDAVKGVRKEMHMVGWESARTGFGEQALFHLAKPSSIEEIVVDTYLHRLNPPLSCHVFGVNLADGDDVGEAMKQAPRYKLIFNDNTEVIPDDFAAYMTQKKYLEEDGVANNRKFKIKVDVPADSPWKPILPFGKLKADTYHRFKELENAGSITHMLYMHYPNGGIHGLKAFGPK